ncbi:hypothetical protein NDU88_005441 [Pleurodeles waltl]|uniref:Uncharacterized protein n=1 Tax=Pleurodeles waltl TaxID=8319 RepID=A0AAV7VJ01_PLEWA|nr:hypothetical protein NDU88_005441 [Pleurodeles waltl]
MLLRVASPACFSCSIFGCHVEVRQRCQASSITRYPGARRHPSTSFYGAVFRLPIGAPPAVSCFLPPPGTPGPPALLGSWLRLIRSARLPDAPGEPHGPRWSTMGADVSPSRGAPLPLRAAAGAQTSVLPAHAPALCRSAPLASVRAPARPPHHHSPHPRDSRLHLWGMTAERPPPRHRFYVSVRNFMQRLRESRLDSHVGWPSPLLPPFISIKIRCS